MAHYYEPPVRSHHQSLRAAQLRPRKRRRHDPDPYDDEDDDDDDGGDTGLDAALTPADALQYRVAGHNPRTARPPAPFPHAAATRTEPKLSPAAVQKELASLRPPVYAPGISSTERITPVLLQSPKNLRQHHLNVMTTLMHNCLLKGDYQRAGRAWGMLLRGDYQGKSMDVRSYGRWGIGAEILLHRYSQNKKDAVRYQFTEEGFRAARDYYERLILEYPYRQTHQRSTNSLTFYPALFDLWIYEICQAKKASIAMIERSSNASELDDDDAESKSDIEDREAQFLAVKANELRQAQELAQRLDELFLSPPFDKHAYLLRLRSMVSLWIGNIQSQNDNPDQARKFELFTEDIAMEDADGGRQVQLEEAKKFFRRSQENGGRLWAGISRVLGDAEG